MKKLSYLLIISLFFGLNSCEEKIELNPENGAPKVAVQAMFTDIPFAAATYVRLSMTKTIHQEVAHQDHITDADVKIIDETDGSTILFTHQSGGQYVTFSRAIPGHSYRLEITARGRQITAHQSMPNSISLNRVVSKPSNAEQGKYYLEMYFNDDPNTTDYYLFIAKNNASGSSELRYMVATDLLYDRENSKLSFYEETYNPGENWTIAMYHIDRPNYDYLKVILNAMHSLQGGSHPFFGIALGNPKNTVEGDALGYFIASPIALSPITIGN